MVIKDGDISENVNKKQCKAISVLKVDSVRSTCAFFRENVTESLTSIISNCVYTLLLT